MTVMTADKKKKQSGSPYSIPQGINTKQYLDTRTGPPILPSLAERSPYTRRIPFQLACNCAATTLLNFVNLSRRAPEQWQIRYSGWHCGPEILDIQSGVISAESVQIRFRE